MKKITLIKVTFAIVVATLASSIVRAADIIPEIAPTLTTSTTNLQFEQLDANKDSLLNLVETEKNELIHIGFTKIDENSDATISKDEFTNYISK